MLKHKKRNFVFPSDHVIFFLLYIIVMIHNHVFEIRFPEDFRPQFKYFRRFAKSFQRLPKIADWRLLKKIRRCFDHTPTQILTYGISFLSIFYHSVSWLPFNKSFLKAFALLCGITLVICACYIQRTSIIDNRNKHLQSITFLAQGI